MSYTIPIGPYHPALEEPVHAKLIVDGERITDAEVFIGYNHRGIEKLAQERNFIQTITLVERVCGICSHSHAWTYCRCIEHIAGMEVSKRAQYIRDVIEELERIHSHLLWLGVACHIVGHDSLFMQLWADREETMDVLENLTGNRVNYAMNIVGGVRRDFGPDQIAFTLKAMDELEDRMKRLADFLTGDKTLAMRTKGVGVLTTEDAIRIGAEGPHARASGVHMDVRKDSPYSSYEDFDFNMVVADSCDVFARVVHGSRLSLSLSIVSMLIAVAVGSLIGAISGYYGGKVDDVLMRLMDMLLAIPPMLMSISIVAALGRSMVNLMLALALAYDGRKQLHPLAFGIGHHLLHHLVDGLLLDLLAADGAVGRTHSGPQQTQIVVDLRHRAHGGAGILGGGLLVDGDGRTQTVNGVHIGLVHLPQEHSCIAAQALHIPPLTLGIDGIKGQAGLAGAGKSRKDHQLVSRNGQVNILQIILSRALDADGVVHMVHLGFQILSYSILYHHMTIYATIIFKQNFENHK